MSRLNRLLLAVALATFASSARAESLRLVAPAAGASLRGGSFAELSWTAEQLPAHAEEWEAFLSLDGGRYYAFRVTPHLDLDRKRFIFLVPNLDSNEARILIRTGNEVSEAHFESPSSFSIVRDPGAEPLVSPLISFGRGEAAREGDPTVLSWTDGARNGAGLTSRSSAPLPLHSLEPHATELADASPAVVAYASDSIATPSEKRAQPSPNQRHAAACEPLPHAVDLLLVCSRRNI